MKFTRILIALVFAFAFTTVTYGQQLNALDKSKRSTLFQLEALRWCKSIREGNAVDSVRQNEIYLDDPLYLWVRIKGTRGPTERLSKGVSPAYIKLFRASSYGLTPEFTPQEMYKINNNNSPNQSPQIIALWTGPFTLTRPGSYYVKLLDYESNTILIKGQPLIRIEVKSRSQMKK